MKKTLALLLTGALAISMLAGCGSSTETTASATTEEAVSVASTEEAKEAATEESAAADTEETEEAATAETEETEAEPTEINVFIAASLNTVMQEVAAAYNEDHPEVTINFNADSSGTLLTQIEEGAACDIFFSAAQKQMNAIEEDGLLLNGERANVVNNQVVVIALKDTDTKVTGLENIGDASSIALADGSVPVGKYTRTALMNLGILPEVDDPSAYTTAEVSEALGGVEISEQSNVSKVLTAVVEGSCEVGTTYFSDTYGYEDQLNVIETVSYDLTGNVIYPVGRIINDEADDAENEAAESFYQFILSDDAKTIFDAYYFDTNVE